jgi:hypothetical protein
LHWGLAQSVCLWREGGGAWVVGEKDAGMMGEWDRG